jgi:hypothetical protein
MGLAMMPLGNNRGLPIDEGEDGQLVAIVARDGTLIMTLIMLFLELDHASRIKPCSPFHTMSETRRVQVRELVLHEASGKVSR